MPDTSFVLPLLLQSGLVPLLVAVAVLATGRELRLRAAAVLAIAGGFVASFIATLYGQWSLVPHSVTDWLPWIAVAGAGGAAFVEKQQALAARIAGRAVLSLAVAALVVWPALESLGALKAVLAVAVITVAAALLWTVLARHECGGPAQPLVLAVVAGGAALALMFDSSQSIGQLSGALGVTLFACFVFALLRVPFPPAAAGVAVLLLAALLANAHIYAGFSLGYVALLTGAVVVPVLALVRKPEAGLAWMPAAVLSAIPVAVTVVLVVKAAHDSGGY